MKIATLSAGAPRHGRAITRQWQSISDENGWGWELDFWEWEPNRGYESYDFATVAWCVWIGLFERCFEFMQMQDECKHIGVFVGTDILQHQQLLQRGYPDFFGSATILLADALHLRDEAQVLTGREVGYVRSIPPEPHAPLPITDWGSILSYVPEGREDFFRWEWIKEIARDYAGIDFHVLARSTTDGIENIHAHLEISGDEKRRLFERCWAYLRPIEHDGIGLTAIELFQMGRFVFHSDPRLFGAIPARSVGEMEFHLDDILRRKRDPIPDIARYYGEEYSRQRLAEDLGRLRKVMEPHV